MPAVPALLTDAGAVDTLAVLLTPSLALLDLAQTSAPAVLADTLPALTLPVLATVQAAHTHLALRPCPVLTAPATVTTSLHIENF